MEEVDGRETAACGPQRREDIGVEGPGKKRFASCTPARRQPPSPFPVGKGVGDRPDGEGIADEVFAQKQQTQDQTEAEDAGEDDEKQSRGYHIVRVTFRQLRRVLAASHSHRTCTVAHSALMLQEDRQKRSGCSEQRLTIPVRQFIVGTGLKKQGPIRASCT